MKMKTTQQEKPGAVYSAKRLKVFKLPKMNFFIHPDFHHRFSSALPIRAGIGDGMSVEEASFNWVAR